MNDLEILAKLQGITLAELAERIGTDRGNLRSGLQGKRPIPEETKRKLFKELGVTEDGLRLITNHVHVWHIVNDSVRLRNVEEMVEALKRLTSEELIGPTWFTTHDSVDVQITVLWCTGQTNKIDPVFGPKHEPLFICLVQNSADAIDISPSQLSPDRPNNIRWLHEYYVNNEYKSPLENQVIPASTFNRIIEGRATYREISQLIEMPNRWTWDRIVFFAKESMTPDEVAGKLGFDTNPPKLER
ncbi:MAG: helix-turn-helix transcriptional regulator [Pseudomonadota bacterium]